MTVSTVEFGAVIKMSNTEKDFVIFRIIGKSVIHKLYFQCSSDSTDLICLDNVTK